MTDNLVSAAAPVVLAVYDDPEHWRAARRELNRYGGTSVSAALDLSKFRTAYEEWAERKGILPPTEQTEAMESGLFMEDGILRWYAHRYLKGTGAQVVHGGAALTLHPDDDLAYCSPDGFVVPGPEAVVARERPEGSTHQVLVLRGALGGVDAKNLSSWARLPWDPAPKDGVHKGWGEPDTDQVPTVYAMQCQWSCYVTGLPWWDLAVSWDGHVLERWRVHAHAESQQIIADAIRRFHVEHIEANVAPAIDVRRADKAVEQLLGLFRDTDEEADVEATEEDVRALLQHHQLARAEAVIGAARKVLKARMIGRLGNAARMVLPGHGEAKTKAQRGRMELVTLTQPKPRAGGTDWEGVADDLASDLHAARAKLAKLEGWEEVYQSPDALRDAVVANHAKPDVVLRRALNVRHGRSVKALAGMLSEARAALGFALPGPVDAELRPTELEPEEVARLVLEGGLRDARGDDPTDVEQVLVEYEPAAPPQPDPDEPTPEPPPGE